MFLGGARGQSAVEFMTVYGWVLLFVIIALLVLYYYGFADLNRLTQKQCVLSSFDCISYKFEKSGISVMNLTFQATNNLDSDISFSGSSVLLSVENIGGSGRNNYTGSCSPSLVRSGELMTCNVNIYDNAIVPSTGQNLNLRVGINYTNCDTAPDYFTSGDCTGGAQFWATGVIITSLEPKVNSS